MKKNFEGTWASEILGFWTPSFGILNFRKHPSDSTRQEAVIKSFLNLWGNTGAKTTSDPISSLYTRTSSNDLPTASIQQELCSIYHFFLGVPFGESCTGYTDV
jgi:hypothetical protein